VSVGKQTNLSSHLPEHSSADYLSHKSTDGVYMNNREDMYPVNFPDAQRSRERRMNSLVNSSHQSSSGKSVHQNNTAGIQSNNIAHEFEYIEKPKISPAWQLARDILETILLTVIMFLVIRFAVQDFQIDGTSMVPTLQDRQFVLVDKVTYMFSEPQRGDVIVFEYPKNHLENYIKRIIGVPGDKVVVDKEGHATVNGVALKETYIADSCKDSPISCIEYPKTEDPTVVPPNTFFVMGDNRGFSSDSRMWGIVKKAEIIGKATLVYWPFSSIHFLPGAQSIFQNVPSSSSVSSGVGQLIDFGPSSLFLVVTLLPLSSMLPLRRRVFAKKKRKGI
jgi:signal peptidase I